MQILTSLQEEVLRIFAETQEAELFYLTGGTALAGFYLQHRFSKDLGLFTKEEEAIGYIGDRLKNNLEAKGIQTKITEGRGPRKNEISDCFSSHCSDIGENRCIWGFDVRFFFLTKCDV